MKKIFSSRFDTALTQVLAGEVRRLETLAGFQDDLYKITIYRCTDDMVRIDFKRNKTVDQTKKRFS